MPSWLITYESMLGNVIEIEELGKQKNLKQASALDKGPVPNWLTTFRSCGGSI